ncbi:Phox homologous domain [Pseudocohnilembus persalinus]|uniref:Phox homologous domain n=1 Tax=Pseudocohnilembus persalinus TaxID=266149 RepID=A0A0V0QSH3_PSEPJ|nr:Phox homologous domain [Pseudocohnilembus persalinus]|eukprot:KRX05127.1 Phox homologous domain [Pseudocohnilembus persalinus]
MSEREQKQNLLRDEILDKGFDQEQFIIDEFVGIIRKPKVDYLHQQISEKHYNIDDFLNFMRNQKIEGDDIDNWTLDELKEKVSFFQNEYYPLYQEPEEDLLKSINQSQNGGQFGLGRSMIMNKNDRKNLLSSSIIKNKNRNNEQNNQKLAMDFNNINQSLNFEKFNQQQLDVIDEDDESNNASSKKSRVSQGYTDDLYNTSKIKKLITVKNQNNSYSCDEFIKQIKCDVQQSNLPKNNPLKIQIIEWEKVNGGIFGWTDRHIQYSIYTNPYEWVVKRRLNDFYILRGILTKMYPGKIIPPLEENHKESNPTDINKRIQHLSFFCNHLQQEDELWSNEFTQIFFSNQEEWHKSEELFKQKYNKEIKKAVNSNSGFITCKISTENVNYDNNIQDYIHFVEANYAELSEQTKNLASTFQHLNECFNKITQVHQNLVMGVKNFNICLEKNIEKNSELQKILNNNTQLQEVQKNVTGMIQSWAKQFKQQGQIADQLEGLFKYHKHQISSMKDQGKQFSANRDKFIKNMINFNKQVNENPDLQNSQQFLNEKQKVYCKFGYWAQTFYESSQVNLWSQKNDYIQFMNYFTRYQTMSINEACKAWSKNIDKYFVNPLPQPKQQLENIDLLQSMIYKK